MHTTSCSSSQEENRETRFPRRGIARIVKWCGSRVESRDECRAYLSSNTASKYFRESGLRVEHYVGKLSSTPMYRSTRESAYRKGAAYRPLFATPSCTFKLQGQAPYIGNTILSPRFFPFLSFTFVNSFRNRALRSRFDLSKMAGQIKSIRPSIFGNSLELERNVRRINIFAIRTL